VAAPGRPRADPDRELPLGSRLSSPRFFSFVPSPLLALASEFRQGDAIVAGKLVASPTLARIGLRWSVESGSDVSADWAALR
jgi:hypothetical protein